MRFYRPLLLATVAIGCLLFFWGLGSIPLLSYNEARRAIPTSGMLVSGDWLLPRVNGELYLSKPPLLYWIAAAFSWLSGSVSEWTVRLPSALSATVIAIVAYRFALRQFGAWPALFAVQVLIANTTFAMFARRAEIEMLLTALCFCSLLSALHYTRGGGHRQWLWLSYFLLGAAVLAKGPVALLFVTLPLLADALCHRQPRLWQALRDPVGWAIFLVIGSSWFLAVTWRMGFGIWHAIVQKDMVEKMSGASAKPLLMYVFWLLADFAPFCLLAFARPLATWRRWKDDNFLLALMLAVGLPLLVFSLFSNKHAKYLLPTYPLVAILFAKRLGELLESATPIVRRSLLAMALICPIGYAVFYAAVESQVFAYRYTAFPKFSAWLGTVGNVPMYGYVDLDERLIYYAKRDIPVLEESSLSEMRSANASFLLLVEGARTDEIAPIADCRVNEFKPYLKRGKTLKVYGFGSVCVASGRALGN
ncbi:ArnT family glycosyltransferase [Propionivibrio soli]|uniref:ArnT family glycosyltransferase n=1 Tax=Propionivibrio soli TaxID=2976531 RepID=UPI0021E7C9F1|nr:glycosyltransferase family 39 protein [Propionivibrio soli]